MLIGRVNSATPKKGVFLFFFRKNCFFEKTKKTCFYVNELNINPEVEVPKSKTVVRVTSHIHTNKHNNMSENRNHNHKICWWLGGD